MSSAQVSRVFEYWESKVIAKQQLPPPSLSPSPNGDPIQTPSMAGQWPLFVCLSRKTCSSSRRNRLESAESVQFLEMLLTRLLAARYRGLYSGAMQVHSGSYRCLCVYAPRYSTH